MQVTSRKVYIEETLSLIKYTAHDKKKCIYIIMVKTRCNAKWKEIGAAQNKMLK